MLPNATKTLETLCLKPCKNHVNEKGGLYETCKNHVNEKRGFYETCKNHVNEKRGP